MIKAIVTVESVSRRAGGLLDGVRRLTQCLAEQGVESQVFSIHDEHTDSDLGLWGMLEPAVFNAKGPAGYSPELLHAVRANEDADIGHGHGLWNYTGIALHQWAQRYGKPCVVSVHGMLNPLALKCSRWKKQIASALFEREYLAGAACIRALSHAEAESIRQYGLSNPICVIPNGVDIPEKDRDDSLSRPLTNNRLLYLGRFHSGKNIENLLRAWKKADIERKGHHGEWKLIVAGWGEHGYEKKLKKTTEKLGLSDIVEFPGPRFDKEKNEMYSSVSGLILPSFYEGFPITVLEAWAHGLPVLITPECNIQDGYDQNAAIRIEADSDSIARGLLEFMGMNQNDRNAMGGRGLALVKENYAWCDVAAKMKSVYDWVLGGGEKPDCVII